MKNLIFSWLLFLSGCGTIFSITDVGYPLVYSGVQDDCKFIYKFYKEAPLGLMPILDLPFSFIADTIILPVSTYWSLTEESRQEERHRQ